jgi:hypothetical protein
VEKTAGVLRVVHIKTFLAKDRIPDDNTLAHFTYEISEIHKVLKMRKIYVDQTGLGNPIIENCREQNLPATGLTLTPTTKEELLSNLGFYFEKKKNCTSRG